MTDSQLIRFLAKVDVSANGCWLWTGATNPYGYGKLYVDGRYAQPYRLAYEHFIDAIPDGHEIDHLCRTPRCVNPTHLEAVTHQTNMRRGLRCRESAVWRGTTPEHREKIRRALTGIVRSADTRARFCIARRARVAVLVHSAETKAKMADARRAYWARKRASVA